MLRVTGLHTSKSLETWSLKYWRMKASCTSLQCNTEVHESTLMAIHTWLSLNSGLSNPTQSKWYVCVQIGSIWPSRSKKWVTLPLMWRVFTANKTNLLDMFGWGRFLDGSLKNRRENEWWLNDRQNYEWVHEGNVLIKRLNGWMDGWIAGVRN